MLDGVRVLDLTDHRGDVGPWLLGRLGADVIKVEPPGGVADRGLSPRYDDQSLHFAAYNDNKRSIVLDRSDPGDRRTLLDLVASSAMVFESGTEGTTAEFGLGRGDLLEVNPRLVHVQVCAFGRDGPRADDPATELTIAALGGPLRIQGSRDRAPVKISVPQVWRHTGAEAAVAALVACARRDTTGRPQFVDVSAQAVMTWTMLNAMEAWEIQGFDFERTGATLELAMTIPLRHPASDGFVVLAPRGANVGLLLLRMISDGIVDRSWADESWADWDQRVIEGEPTAHGQAEVVDAVERFCRQYSKSELLELGRELGVTIAPINDVADLVDFEHLEARRFWDTHPELGVSSPGPFLTIDGKRPHFPRSVPAVGEHSDQLRVELKSAPPPVAATASDQPDTGLPLEGLKVADFSWIGVGPMTAKCLADHGADVVRVESANRIDGLRVQPPFKDDLHGLDRSNFWGTFNTSKSSLAIDLKTEAGLAVARRLVDWADVVIDSFTPGAMARLGLGPEEIRRTNPDVITVTTSLLGSGGPHSDLGGYGYHAAAIAGFFGLVGWPDRPPDGPWLAYTDTIGPRFITPALLAAIDRRRRTGEGCHIEAAQLEIALQLLAPELLDFQLTGAVAGRLGNRDREMAPQGVYPCAGDDCWAAISVTDDSAWRRLRLALDDPEWARSATLDNAEGRMANHDAIDAGIAAWTITRTEDEVEAWLLAAGVPAAKVQRSRDLAADPQYLHRSFYRRLEHDEVGTIPYAGHQYRIEGYDHGPRRAAPTLGQHTFEVLTEKLSFGPEEFAEFATAGALD